MRPVKKINKTKKATKIFLRIEPAIKDRLTIKANKIGSTKSAIIQTLINNYLALS